MSAAAKLTVNPSFTVAEVPSNLFGALLEHMGRGVYTGVYEPDRPTADAAGLRTDVLELVRELGVTMIRYPGGNYVSTFRWEDSVGPVEERPVRLDPAWRSIEPNSFGLAEFMDLMRKIDASPLMALNLGTRGVAEAMELFEYTNFPGGTRLSDLRRAHGAERPYDVRTWCLGNELDGLWEIGHKTAAEYGRLAAETARALRAVDPDVRLVACGSSNPRMETFPAWEAEVLDEVYDLVDYISLHAYYEEYEEDRDSFLAAAANMEAFIGSVAATCDYIQAKKRSPKRMQLCFDEWNVWYLDRFIGTGLHSEWMEHPRLLEDQYSVTDAVVFGSLLIALLRHCDRVKAACIAQLVNVIGPVMTEPGGPAWRQTTFFPFSQVSRYGRGTVLRVSVEAPEMDTQRYGTVPLLHAVAVHGADGTVTVFAVNRSQREDLSLQVDLSGFKLAEVVEHSVLTDSDPEAGNTLRDPERVQPVPWHETRIEGGTLLSEIPPLSWNMIRLAP